MQPMDGHFYTKDEETLWTRVFVFFCFCFSFSFFSWILLLLMSLLMMMLMLILLLLMLLLSLFFIWPWWPDQSLLSFLTSFFYFAGLSYFSKHTFISTCTHLLYKLTTNSIQSVTQPVATKVLLLHLFFVVLEFLQCLISFWNLSEGSSHPSNSLMLQGKL